MKKKLTVLAIAMIATALAQTAKAYDFSAVSPSGHTLYYNIVDGLAQVTHPNNSSWQPYDGYTKPSGALIIPSSVTNDGTTYVVASIDSYIFDGCPITSVTIPSSVSKIGSYAFINCEYLTNTYFSGTIAEWCAITFDESTSNPIYYSHNLYINNELLTQLVIPEGVTEIKDYAFTYCKSITGTISLPNSLTSIGEWAFSECSGISGLLSIPNNVINIGKYAFYNCINITGSLILPSSLTTISNYAFSGMYELESVTIPASVSLIGSGAFINCFALGDITVLATEPPAMGTGAFYTSATLHVPCASLSAYQASARWGAFSNIVGLGCPATITAISSNAAMGTTYGSGAYGSGETAVLMALPALNHKFGGWSDGTTTNPYTITVSDDFTVTALFAPSDTIVIHDTTEVHDGDNITLHDTVVINNYQLDTTIINTYQYDTVVLNYYQFDTTHINIYDTSIVNNYQYDTVIINNYQYDTVIVNNYQYDTVYVNSIHHDSVFVYNYIHDTVYLNRNIFDTVYIHDTIVTNAVTEVSTINAKLYQRDEQIAVEGAEGHEVILYDVTGRMLATKRNDYGMLLFDVPSSGAYLVRIGDLPARRIVVVK